MSEIRQSIVTKQWVIIATERARRPDDFAQANRELTGDRPPWRTDCPFCPGNEEPSVTERLRVPAEGPWQVRVLSNKYPALYPDGDRTRRFEGIYRVMAGVGCHEVIVETPRHNTCLALMPDMEGVDVLRAFQTRGRAYIADRRIEHIVYFENHGAQAGTSVEHPHAQMVGLPLVPHDVRGRLADASRYFDDNGVCVFCDVGRAELAEAERLIAQNEHFTAFIPYAALSPFHTWILPRRHTASFLDARPDEIAALASILRGVLGRLYIGLNDPDYNLIIRSVPLHFGGQEWMHWYVSVIPHVTSPAGFEMGSGMFINTALPEESAAFLRSIDPDQVT